MASNDAEREAQFAQLLADYEQQLASGVRPAIDSSVIDDDALLATEFSGAKACLALLQRVRRQWSPLADEETPAPTSGALETVPTDSPLPNLGRFRIEREIGRGGLGSVYLAYDPKLHRQVAVKVPLPHALVSADLRRRFLREAEAAARLSHPHIVTVLEAGEVGAVCYIAAEYCPGPTLREWLLKHPQGLEVSIAAQAVLQLALAVQHAHGRGVLHRDIKPSNVLVDGTDPLSLKLTDFGMAKLLEDSGEQTRSGAWIGTPAYMSPEQAQGRVSELDARTDLYALGAILYEALTGRRLHHSATDVDALRSVLFEEPTPPRVLRPAIPRDLEAIVLKCVAKRPDDRYATVQQLADDLTRFLAGEPTQARPLGPLAKLWKWSKRRPAAAALAGVLAAAAVTLFGVVLVYSNRLREEVVRADAAMHHAQQETEASRRLLYAADIRLAHEAYKVNNVQRATELLDRNVPEPGQEDLREFAWHYLSGLCRPRTRRLIGHGKPVHAVAYSPDGKLLATGGEDGTARIWAADTGEQLHVLDDGAIEVPCVAFSPDGKTLATGHVSHGIRLWDVQTGAAGRLLSGHTDHVMALAYSPDGKWLVSGGRDGRICVWDTQAGELVKKFEEYDVVRGVAFSIEGDQLYAVDENGRAALWTVADWKRRLSIRRDDKLFAIAVSPRDNRVLAAGRRRDILDVEERDGEIRTTHRFEAAHSEWIQALAFSPDGQLLASAGKDAAIQIWNADKNQPARAILGHTGQIWSLCWSPDGSELASAGDDGVRIWKLNGLSPQRHLVETPLRHVEFSAKLPQAYATDANHDFTLRDSRDFSLLRPLKKSTRLGSTFRISADEQFVATSTTSNHTDVWRMSDWENVYSQDIESRYDVFAWAPVGNRLATSNDGVELFELDMDTGQVTNRARPTNQIRAAGYSPDGQYLVVSGEQIDILDAKTMKLRHRIDRPGRRVTISPDSRWLAVSAGPTIQLTDLRDGFRTGTLASSGVGECELTFCGNTLAVGVEEPAMVCLWDTRTRQEMLRLTSDCVLLRGVYCSPDGRRLIAWGRDAEGQGAVWEWSLED